MFGPCKLRGGRGEGGDNGGEDGGKRLRGEKEVDSQPPEQSGRKIQSGGGASVFACTYPREVCTQLTRYKPRGGRGKGRDNGGEDGGKKSRCNT
jgi:hypothetical protein